MVRVGEETDDDTEGVYGEGGGEGMAVLGKGLRRGAAATEANMLSATDTTASNCDTASSRARPALSRSGLCSPAWACEVWRRVNVGET